MHRLWGWLDSAQQPANTQILARMSRESPFDSASQTSAAIAAEKPASVAHEGDTLAVITGCARFEEPPSRGISPAQNLLSLWKNHGIDALKKIHGSFSLAIVNSHANTLLLAVDRVGIQHLCFAPTDHGIVFGSNCDNVLAHPSVRREINPQGIFNYLFAHMVPAPGTIWLDIEKLLPAQYLLFQDGLIKKDFYWEAPWDVQEHPDFSELSSELLSLLDKSIREPLDGRPIGSFLSGGTDSSTISGMLTRILGQPANTFSIGFEAAGFDEMEYARIASKHFGTKPHEYYVTPDDVVKAIPLIAAAYDEPFGNASAVPTYFCALNAKQVGVDILLAGDGGDEIFGGNKRYAAQNIFELYHRIPNTIRKHLIEPVSSHLPTMPPFNKLASYIRQASVPLPDRLESYNFLHSASLDSIFTPEFISTVNPDDPLTAMREVFFRTRSDSTISRMLHLDWKQTLADNDLRKVNRMCELAGVEVRYPLLDERILNFAAQLPDRYKVRGSKLRWFFKEALRDFLPSQIINKSKHGFGLPFGLWMHQHPPLHALAHESLHAFRKRNIILPAYLDNLDRLHKEGHASYYGVMIWVVMMLEQWLQHHENI